MLTSSKHGQDHGTNWDGSPEFWIHKSLVNTLSLETFDNFLQGLPFNKVDKICFYRYLAMGMVGGGWMSDFDTFPLNAAKWDGTGNPMLLPNSGSLTIHEKTESGGVPSLVSGKRRRMVSFG
jgi:hypothetical protein